jgi:hypothetical protein
MRPESAQGSTRKAAATAVDVAFCSRVLYQGFGHASTETQV